MKNLIQKIKDILWKLKVLIISMLDNYKSWKEVVWEKELDELYCCNGRECGCMATTNRENIQWQYQVDVPPIKPIVVDLKW